MADTLEFKLIDPIEAKEAWALEYGSRCRGVEIYINGREIVQILKEIETPYATKEGKPHLAGDYGHNAPKHLYRELTEAHDGAELLCCGGCGDSGCWSVLVSVRQDENYVYWEKFEHNHRAWEYPLSYRFDKQEYEQAMHQLKVASLFEGMEDSLILSCLQKVMGHLYVNDENQPTAAMAILGDFCFLAGEPDRELVLYKPEWCTQDFMIMIPQNEAWASMIEDCYGDKAKRVTRYAIKKEQGIFDKEHLESVVNTLPEGYTLTMMDEELFYRCQKIDWCKEWVAQYPDYELYRKYGLGALVLKNGEPVSGASSYSGYNGGIEIEIKTHEEHRRKGLAYICGAKLILECLERDLYPNWDAQNKWSVGLAEKLGYHFSREYAAYEIWGY